jgi:hypothetical protein
MPNSYLLLTNSTSLSHVVVQLWLRGHAVYNLDSECIVLCVCVCVCVCEKIICFVSKHNRYLNSVMTGIKLH